VARTLLEKVFMDDLTLKIDTGAPVEVPAFEPDECGHNWLAVTRCGFRIEAENVTAIGYEDRDPRAPGGRANDSRFGRLPVGG
jgi:hypothetical protein